MGYLVVCILRCDHLKFQWLISHTVILFPQISIATSTRWFDFQICIVLKSEFIKVDTIEKVEEAIHTE